MAPTRAPRFVPPSASKQREAIGFERGGRPALTDKSEYDRSIQAKRGLWEALGQCFDPSGGDWEDIDQPEPSEWLYDMLDRTPDQSFRDFVASRPNRPSRSQHVIYLLPLCHPEETEGPTFPEGSWPSWKALETAVTYFYAPLEVRALPAIPMESLKPRPQSRKNSFGTQWNAQQVLDGILRKGLPSDAYCMLGVTMWDLFPRPEWNFVYGLARLKERVGVFSFCRHAPERRKFSPEAMGAHLLFRSMKTMLHEIGHMFGLKHCTYFNCLMRGNNGEGVEHQMNYLHLCPVCLRKLHWQIGFDVVERYTNLLSIYQEYEGVSPEFRTDCDFFRRRLQKLSGLEPATTFTSNVVRSPGNAAQASPGNGGLGKPRAESQPALARARDGTSMRDPVRREKARKSTRHAIDRSVTLSTAKDDAQIIAAEYKVLDSPTEVVPPVPVDSTHTKRTASTGATVRGRGGATRGGSLRRAGMAASTRGGTTLPQGNRSAPQWMSMRTNSNCADGCCTPEA